MNTQYWRKAQSKAIPGANRLPQGEFYSHLKQHGNVLDLGCGNGLIAHSIAENGFAVTGVDLNEEAILQNKKKYPEITFLLADITKKLLFQPASFDAVILGFILVNIISKSARELLIASLYDLLKPGGIIWFHEGLVSSKYEERYTLCRDFVLEDHDFFSYSDKDLAGAISTREQLEEALRAGKVERTVHHFEPTELKALFKDFTLLEWKIQRIWSPRSGSPLETVVGVVRKPQ